MPILRASLFIRLPCIYERSGRVKLWQTAAGSNYPEEGNLPGSAECYFLPVICFITGLYRPADYDGLTMKDILLPKLTKVLISRLPIKKAWDTLDWMGFEAREAILALLDEAIADTTAEVRVVAYDLNEPEVVYTPHKTRSKVKDNH